MNDIEDQQMYDRIKKIVLPIMGKLSAVEEVTEVVLIVQSRAGITTFGSLTEPKEYFKFLTHVIYNLVFKPSDRREKHAFEDGEMRESVSLKGEELRDSDGPVMKL